MQCRLLGLAAVCAAHFLVLALALVLLVSFQDQMLFECGESKRWLTESRRVTPGTYRESPPSSCSCWVKHCCLYSADLNGAVIGVEFVSCTMRYHFFDTLFPGEAEDQDGLASVTGRIHTILTCARKFLRGPRSRPKLNTNS